MRRRSTAFAALLALATLAAFPAHASPMLEEFRDVRQRGRFSLIADIDNDSMLLKRDDGFYTSGLRLSGAWTLAEGGEARTWEWHVGQDLYTASDIKLLPAQIQRNDHPYAGWLYFGLSRRVDAGDGSYRQVGLDLGCLGPCAGGEWTQKTLHSIIRQPKPEGWSTQVGNEWGAVLYGKWAPWRYQLRRDLDLTPALHGRFGNITTDAGLELVLRAGRLNRVPNAPAFFAYLRGDARAVGYNATLQGGYFSNNPGRTVSPRRAVGEIEAGLTWQGRRYGFTVAVTRRSNEIADLPNSTGSQNFAKVQLVFQP